MFRWTFIATLALAAAVVAANPTPGTRYAVVVGVKDYDHSKLKPLAFTENDAAVLARTLREARYTVELLTDSEGRTKPQAVPTLANVRARLRAVLARCKRHDTIMVALAGHGLQIEGKKDSYFCPKDANPTNARTLVSLTELYRELDGCGAGVKLLLVDACRDDPAAGQSRGVDGANAPRPPRGVAALFSCSAGQRAFESDKLKHGVFFHYVLEGLREPTVRNERGEVTWGRLADFVTEKVSREVPKIVGGGAKQEPNLIADLSGRSPVIVNAAVKVESAKPTPVTPAAKATARAVDARAAAASEIAMGRSHLGRREYRAAATHFAAAVGHMPSNAAAYLMRAEAYAGMNDFAKAIVDLNVCIRLDPGNAHYFYRAAMVRHEMGELGKAVADCNEALRLNPGFAEAARLRERLVRERGVTALRRSVR